MTPEEHYLEAERLVNQGGIPVDTLEWLGLMAEAQVHATLATVRTTSHERERDKLRDLTITGVTVKGHRQ